MKKNRVDITIKCDTVLYACLVFFRRLTHDTVLLAEMEKNLIIEISQL